jgi:hypothetical protein
MLGDLRTYFLAQIEGDGQSLFCLMTISLLFYPLTPFGHGHVVKFFPALSRFFRVFCRLGRLLFSISQVLVSGACEGRAQQSSGA